MATFDISKMKLKEGRVKAGGVRGFEECPGCPKQVHGAWEMGNGCPAIILLQHLAEENAALYPRALNVLPKEERLIHITDYWNAKHDEVRAEADAAGCTERSRYQKAEKEYLRHKASNSVERG